ncbi:MAG TPA: NB-ARC domain-containing protein [Ktedonobacteraceae bacterium]|nr:NB-ARC domain-containing protein [Ktedonobacteraceae bacterium]
MESLSTIIRKYLRDSGYSQSKLADALGLHPKVLSRKVNKYKNDRLNRQEVKKIITTLATWHAITSREEVEQLLAAAEVETSIISDDEWQSPPLNALTPHSPITHSHHGTTPPGSLASRRHNFPSPTTRLIGREWASTRLQQLLALADVRLVTLVGVGGSGKTRLALHVARELVNSFAHGAWFVSLAGVREADAVPLSIMQALNISSASDQPPLQQLLTYLNNKQLLLVLDNIEQVVGMATILDELLAQAPTIKVLLTSRVLLRLYGEHAFNVPPLDVPTIQRDLKAADVLSFPAVQLFVERAQAAHPDFALNDENAAAVAQICARVDGLPLALELAAARTRLLTPIQLLERLSKARLPLLTGGARNMPDRHHTLRNTVAWSYNLLSPDEQAWFRSLGVFSGAWSLEAGETLMQIIAEQRHSSDYTPPLDVLDLLVENSLLVRLPHAHADTYFMLLETLREYALEQLARHGEDETLRDLHACYYLRVAEASVQGLRGPQQLSWLARLTRERENFQAAFQWLLQRSREGRRIEVPVIPGQQPLTEKPEDAKHTALSAVELCLRLATAFRPYWEWKGYLTEGRSWLLSALELVDEQETERSVLIARARALSQAARLVDLQNDLGRALVLAEASIALCRQLDDVVGLAGALLHRGWVAHAQGDYATGKRVYREGLRELPLEVDPWLYAELLFHLGDIEGNDFNFDEMHRCLERSQKLFEQLGDRSAIADLLKDQGGLLLLESKYDEAIASLLQSLRLCYELDHKQFIATGLGWMSFALGLSRLPDEETACIHAALIGGAAEALMDSIGLTPWTRTYPVAVLARKRWREIVGEERWNAAWQQGRDLNIEQAIELAHQLGEET